MSRLLLRRSAKLLPLDLAHQTPRINHPIKYNISSSRTRFPPDPCRRLQSLAHASRPKLGSQPSQTTREASLTPYFVLFALVTTTAVLVDYWTVSEPESEIQPDQEKFTIGQEVSDPFDLDEEISALFAAMPTPPGTLGNLTAEQEQKLKEFWAITLKTFGIKDPSEPENTSTARPITPADAPIVAEPDSAKRKERHSIFHRKHRDSVPPSGSSSPGFGGSADVEDKYGQTKELQEILANTPAANLHAAFWSMVKKDHPDALLLRFLRARKWDVQRALAMLISTMHWRKSEMHVDDDIMLSGEGGALKDSQSSDASTKREGSDFLAQLRLGKSFIHGIDKEGRPICFVRVRLHRSGEQTERALERYTVYVIETCRLALTPPVETATIVFDMTSFTMANMDYTPVKFMIKVFEANYPESLGCVLVHKAPWIFQGIWKIIRGWLDPVVAGKVHFTNDVKDLTEFIPKEHIITELGGDEHWEYKYVEPLPEENAAMNDEETKQKLVDVRQQEVAEYEKKTFDWIRGEDTKTQRDEIAARLNENYWKQDPIIRARSLYDRTGMIGKDGKLNYYPTQTAKTDNLPPAAAAAANGVPKVETSADDVD